MVFCFVTIHQVSSELCASRVGLSAFLCLAFFSYCLLIPLFTQEILEAFCIRSLSWVPIQTWEDAGVLIPVAHIFVGRARQ